LAIEQNNQAARQELAQDMARLALRLRQLEDQGHRLTHDEWLAVYAMEQVAKTRHCTPSAHAPSHSP